jgi:hypothetical protein
MNQPTSLQWLLIDKPLQRDVLNEKTEESRNKRTEFISIEGLM